MHVKTLFLFVFLLVLIGCNQKSKENEIQLEQTIWVYDSSNLPQDIRDFTEFYVYFRNKEMMLNSFVYSKYLISHDTIYVNPLESATRKKSTFKGKVLFADTNKIVIKRLEGAFPIMNSEMDNYADNSDLIVLKNLRSKKKNPIHLDFISIATSHGCVSGSEYYNNIELGNQNKLNLNGRPKNRPYGNYSCTITSKEMNQIIDHLSYLKLTRDSTFFRRISCSGNLRLILGVNGKKYFFEGEGFYFQFDLQQVMILMDKFSKKHTLKSNDNTFDYKAEFEFELPPFIPPQP